MTEYTWADIKPTKRKTNVNQINAERIWWLRDEVIDYRADNCTPYDLEASALAIAIQRMEKSALAAEQGDIDQAVAHLLDAQPLVTSDLLTDKIAILANDLAGHPLECQCVLPEQSCPVCRVAMSNI